MLCPFCSDPDIKVLETRETSESETRRRRECLKCGKRFTTYERLELKPIIVVKKDGSREEFERQKIIRGLLSSCQKRSVSITEIEKLVDDVEYKIRSLGNDEVKSTKVGQLVMNRLKKLDKVAYIRFASVYRDFADVENFGEEIERLTQRVIEKNASKKE